MTAISDEEYQEIRRKFMRNRAKKLEAGAVELLAEPEVNPVVTVDELMAFPESLPPPQDRPATPEGTSVNKPA